MDDRERKSGNMLAAGVTLAAVGAVAAVAVYYSTRPVLSPQATTLTTSGPVAGGVNASALVSNTDFQSFKQEVFSRNAVFLAKDKELQATGSFLAVGIGNNSSRIKDIQTGIDKLRDDIKTIPAGPAGSAGPPGPPGSSGAKGDTGAMGPAGSSGPRGEAGSRGAMGPAGSPGAKGDTGAMGPAGSMGPRGSAGPAGPAGSMDPVWYTRIAQKADKGELGSLAAYAQTQFALKANQADLGRLAGSLSARDDKQDALIDRNSSAIAQANDTLVQYTLDIAKISARVKNLELQVIYSATISDNQTDTTVSWNSVVRSANNESAYVSIVATNGVTGIRLSPGTYIITTAISTQQAYTAWTMWAWKEITTGAWVGGSEIALVGNGPGTQAETGALILRVDEAPTAFALQLKEQATNGGPPTILAKKTQVVVIGINVTGEKPITQTTNTQAATQPTRPTTTQAATTQAPTLPVALIAVTRGEPTTTSYTNTSTAGWQPVSISDGSMKFTGEGSGKGNYLSYPTMTVDPQKGITIVACFRFNQSAQWQRILDFGNGSPADNIVLCQSNNEKLRFGMYRAGGEDAAENTLKVGSVQVAIAVYDPTNNQLSLEVRDSVGSNGNKVFADPRPPSGMYTTSRSLGKNYLGKSNWSQDSYANLDIFGLRVHNSILTPQQVETIVTSSLPSVPREGARAELSVLSAHMSAEAAKAKPKVTTRATTRPATTQAATTQAATTRPATTQAATTRPATTQAATTQAATTRPAQNQCNIL